MKKILFILLFFVTTAKAQKITLTQVRAEISAATAILKKQNADSTAKLRRELTAALLKLEAANKKALADSSKLLDPIVLRATPVGAVDGVNKTFQLGIVDSNTVKVWATDDGKRYYLLGKDWYSIYNTGRLVMKEAPKFPLIVDYMK